MKNNEELINKIPKERTLELSTWWGLSRNPGSKHLIYTDDYIYEYTSFYCEIPEDVMENDLFHCRKLTPEAKEKLDKYIEDNLINLESSSTMIFDAGWDIFVSYKNKKIKINNDIDLYKKVYKEIHNIIGGINE